MTGVDKEIYVANLKYADITSAGRQISIISYIDLGIDIRPDNGEKIKKNNSESC